jgi:hypothetical protein
MIHLTAFGYTEAEIAPAGFTAFTIYGYTKLKRPTLAQRIMQRRRARQQAPSKMDTFLGRDRSMVITLFGGTEIGSPTLIEEYAALRNLMKSGGITKAECLDLIEGLAESDQSDISRITIFGGCGYESPSPKEEKKALDAAEDAGMITSSTRRELAEAIGSREPALAGIVARAALS